MSGNHPPTNSHFRQSLRPDDARKDKYRRRARSAPRTRRDDINEGGNFSRAADKAAEKDADWRCGSFRYANAQFYDSLRSWNGKADIATRTPKDWRVSSADLMKAGAAAAGVGAYGHDFSGNNADDWRRSSPIWVEKQFREKMNVYEGHDVAYGEDGHIKRENAKSGVGIVGESIWRDAKQASRLSTAKADQFFEGSLRSTDTVDRDEYQRRRRRNLNLPAFKDIPATEVSKAKRLFAQIDLNGDGSIDAEELKTFLGTLGHKVQGGPQAVQDLIKAADEGAPDCKLQIKEFARVYNGLKL